MENFIVWTNGKKKPLKQTENLQNIGSVAVLTFCGESSRIVSLQKVQVLLSFHFWQSFLKGRPCVRHIHVYMLDIQLQFWVRSNKYFSGSFEGCQNTANTKRSLQLFSSLEAVASENVLLKMAWQIILVTKGSCTTENGRFYPSWTKALMYKQHLWLLIAGVSYVHYFWVYFFNF